MNRRPFYLAAIALHMLVLFWMAPERTNIIPKDDKQYVEVILSSEPGPARPGLDSGSSDKAKAAVAPGPIVKDSPPMVDTITPEPTPPSAVPPSTVAKQTALSDPQSAPIGPLTQKINSTPTTVSPVTPAGAPVSDAGHGNARQWSKGVGGNGHYYEAIYTPEGINWVDAQKYALLHGGYLATITSTAENNAVYFLIKDPKFWRRPSSLPIEREAVLRNGNGQYWGPWFGACNPANTPVWEWVNHEGPLKYANWYPGKPLEGPAEYRLYALHYYTEGFSTAEATTPAPTWNVVYSGYKMLGFVVEYDRDPAKLP